MEALEELSRRVRAARAYAELTQEDLAARLDVSIVTYKRVEQAKRDLSSDEMRRVSEITQMPLAFFTVDLTLLDDNARAQEQLQTVEERLQHLVGRLEDVEYRMRQPAPTAARRP